MTYENLIDLLTGALIAAPFVLGFLYYVKKKYEVDE